MQTRPEVKKRPDDAIAHAIRVMSIALAKKPKAFESFSAKSQVTAELSLAVRK